jgi:hypothetical protein
MNKTRPKILRLLLPHFDPVCGSGVTSHASDPKNATRCEICALYLYNFLLFVDWPKDVCLGSNTVRISILGAPRIYEAMKPMSGKRIKGKKLAIFSLTGSEKMDDFCQVFLWGIWNRRR